MTSLGKACNFDINYFKKDRRQQGQGGLMVMTPSFHPGDPGSIITFNTLRTLLVKMAWQWIRADGHGKSTVSFLSTFFQILHHCHGSQIFRQVARKSFMQSI